MQEAEVKKVKNMILINGEKNTACVESHQSVYWWIFYSPFQKKKHKPEQNSNTSA